MIEVQFATDAANIGKAEFVALHTTGSPADGMVDQRDHDLVVVLGDDRDLFHAIVGRFNKPLLFRWQTRRGGGPIDVERRIHVSLIAFGYGEKCVEYAEGPDQRRTLRILGSEIV